MDGPATIAQITYLKNLKALPDDFESMTKAEASHLINLALKKKQAEDKLFDKAVKYSPERYLNPGWIRYYVDAGVSDNGGPKQNCRVVVVRDLEVIDDIEAGSMTNNEGEFYAILLAVSHIHGNGDKVEIFSDSQIAVNVSNRTWNANASNLAVYAEKVWKEIEKHPFVIIKWVKRDDNLAGFYIAQHYGL